MIRNLNEFDKLLYEMEKNDALNKRVDKIINGLFKDEELMQAKTYEGIIVSYLKSTIKQEYLKDDMKLASIINVYFHILLNRDVTIDKYLFLQSCSKTYDNEISREIEKKYLDSKFVLMSASDLFDISIDEYSDADRAVDEILIKYEDRNIRGRIYSNLFQKYKNDQEKCIAITKALVRIDKAYNVLMMIKASNGYVPNKEQKTK